MVKNHYTNSMKSSASRPSRSTSNAKIPHEVNSSKSSAYLSWGYVSTVTTGIFLNAKTIEEGKKPSVTNTVTPCQKDNKLSPKNVKNIADDDKNESLKEAKTESEVAFDANLKKFVNKIKNEALKQAKTADSEVACDANKLTVNDNFCTSNDNTEIMKYIPGLEGINENGVGINYEDDVNIDECNDNNDNKPSLNDYHLSQYITSQTSNVSLTQLGETSLSNVRTNLDFYSISILSE